MLTKGQTKFILSTGASRAAMSAASPRLLTAGATLPFYNEYAMAQEAEAAHPRRRAARDGSGRRAHQLQRESARTVQGRAGSDRQGRALTAAAIRRSASRATSSQTVAEIEGVKEDYVAPSPDRAIRCIAPPARSPRPREAGCMGDPGYGGGAPEFIGSKTVRVPLRADFSHDVEAMIKADPERRRLLRLQSEQSHRHRRPPRKDIEYLLANKKSDAVVVVDEAYIHFSETRPALQRPGGRGQGRRGPAHVLQGLRHGRNSRRLRAGASGPAREDAALRRRHAADHRTWRAPRPA